MTAGRLHALAAAAFAALSTLVVGTAPVVAADPALPYPERGGYRIKAIQPDFWPDKAEIAGNNTGGVAMNLVWADWQPTRKAEPCTAGEETYDGYCFTVPAQVDADIAGWTARGLAVTSVVYGVPAWARQGKACTPAAPGFDIFCTPTDPADYGRWRRGGRWYPWWGSSRVVPLHESEAVPPFPAGG